MNILKNLFKNKMPLFEKRLVFDVERGITTAMMQMTEKLANQSSKIPEALKSELSDKAGEDLAKSIKTKITTLGQKALEKDPTLPEAELRKLMDDAAKKEMAAARQKALEGAQTIAKNVATPSRLAAETTAQQLAPPTVRSPVTLQGANVPSSGAANTAVTEVPALSRFNGPATTPMSRPPTMSVNPNGPNTVVNQFTGPQTIKMPSSSAPTVRAPTGLQGGTMDAYAPTSARSAVPVAETAAPKAAQGVIRSAFGAAEKFVAEAAVEGGVSSSAVLGLAAADVAIIGYDAYLKYQTYKMISGWGDGNFRAGLETTAQVEARTAKGLTGKVENLDTKPGSDRKGDLPAAQEAAGGNWLRGASRLARDTSSELMVASTKYGEKIEIVQKNGFTEVPGNLKNAILKNGLDPVGVIKDAIPDQWKSNPWNYVKDALRTSPVSPIGPISPLKNVLDPQTVDNKNVQKTVLGDKLKYGTEVLRRLEEADKNSKQDRKDYTGSLEAQEVEAAIRTLKGAIALGEQTLKNDKTADQNSPEYKALVEAKNAAIVARDKFIYDQYLGQREQEVSKLGKEGEPLKQKIGALREQLKRAQDEAHLKEILKGIEDVQKDYDKLAVSDGSKKLTGREGNLEAV